jgi:hypothetical protein
VAIRELVLEAVAAKPLMRVDGGVMVEADGVDHSNERPEDCDCSPHFEELPCWPCYRDGFEEPAGVSGGQVTFGEAELANAYVSLK